jgi:hypothetical protein
MPRPAVAQPPPGQHAAEPSRQDTVGPDSGAMMMTPARADTTSTSRLATGQDTAGAQATAATAAAVAVASQAQVMTPVAQPSLAPPVSGTVYGGRAGTQADGDRLGRPLDPLRLESHRAPLTALDRLLVPGAATGLLLGRDHAHTKVVIRLFRPEVTRMALVGGLWQARLVIFRSLALGARVVVFTNRPNAWDGFGRAATGREDRLAVMAAERPIRVAASPASPALHVYDLGSSGPTLPPSLGPWSTQLTVLPSLTAFGFESLQGAHITLLRRLVQQEVSSAVSVLGLKGTATSLVQQVRDDMMTVVASGVAQYTFLQPTGVELRLFGQPHV